MAFDYTDSALVRAVLNNKPDDVREALSRGFSANLRDNRGWTPFLLAAVDDARNECLKELLSHSSTHRDIPYALIVACERNCVMNVKLLLQHLKCTVNLIRLSGVTPLCVACYEGNIEVVKCLIECGADVNIANHDDYTALHGVVALFRSDKNTDEISYEICKYLLEHGANPDTGNSEWSFPFHLACQSSLFKCAKLLLSVSKQNDLINFNYNGLTPLMNAVLWLNVSVIEFLLGQGANVNIAIAGSFQWDVTALHLAAHTGDYNMFSLILRETSKECVFKYCTFDEERDFEELTVGRKLNSLICLAIDTENLEFVTQVLESELDPAALTCPVISDVNYSINRFTLHTPITYLLQRKMCKLGRSTVDFLDTLIAHGIPLNVTSKHMLVDYICPIFSVLNTVHKKMRQKKKHKCKCLMSLNDSPSDVGVECLKVLLQRGADPDERRGGMPIAMEGALKMQNIEAVLLLLQHSNVLEPDDVINWLLDNEDDDPMPHWILEDPNESDKKIIEVLLPLVPYYKPPHHLHPYHPMREVLLAPKVYPLTHYCRTIIRKQVRKESELCPTLFRHYLSDLLISKDLCSFLSFM